MIITTPRYDHEIYDNVADQTPAPGVQMRQNLTITFGGFLATLYFDEARNMNPYRLTWNGIEFVKSTAHGDGLALRSDNYKVYYADASSWNVDSPTGPGCQRDGTSMRFGSSQPRARWSDTTSIRHRSLAANWADPDQDITPGQHPRNCARLSDSLGDTIITMGAFGQNNIILVTTTLYAPSTPRVQVTNHDLKQCPISVYSDTAVFNQQEYCDPSTGIFSVYAGYPANSNTLSVCNSHSDGSKAIGPYCPSSQLGPLGYNSGYTASGIYDAFIICEQDYTPAGVPAGPRTQTTALIFGTRAQYAASLQICKANLG